MSISPQEFEELYHEYHPRFVSVALSYVRDRMVAEDLVAESFAYFWENRERIELQSTPAAYIFKGVKFQCLTWLRNQSIRLRIQNGIKATSYRTIQSSISALEACDPEMLFTGEITELFMKQLEQMPELTRNVFVSSRFEEQTYSEIAEKYDITVRRVTSEIQRALALMRVALKDYLPALLIWLNITLLK